MEANDSFDRPAEPADPFSADGASEADALDHLWNAAHEMLRAMRTLVDAADEFVEAQREARTERATRDPDVRRAESRVRHINIDGRSTDGPVDDIGREAL